MLRLLCVAVGKGEGGSLQLEGVSPWMGVKPEGVGTVEVV